VPTKVLWWSEKWPTNSVMIDKITSPKKEKGIKKDNLMLVYLIDLI